MSDPRRLWSAVAFYRLGLVKLASLNLRPPEETVAKVSSTPECGSDTFRSLVATGHETVAKLARFMCGRAIKPVRPPSGTKDFLRLNAPDHVTCNGLKSVAT